MGAGNVVGAHVVVEGSTEIGEGNHFTGSCVIGGRPQIAGIGDGEGRLTIGDRNVFREFTTIHGGLREATRIGSNCLFMVGSHVAHDCELGDAVTMVNCAGVAGHVVVETGAQLGGHSAVHQNVRIGAYAFLAGGAMVAQDVPPFCTVQGVRALLVGVNSKGLFRAGFSRTEIGRIRGAFRAMVHGDGSLPDRLSLIDAQYDDPNVHRFTSFVRGGSRGVITTPRRALSQA